jgi:thiol-disulfide isomerase/thioredoxin
VKLSLPLILVVGVAGVVSLGMAVAVLVPAVEKRAPESDPAAKELLGEVAKTYQRLDAYSDQGEFVLSVTTNGNPVVERTPLKVSMVRPNKVRFNTGEVLVVSDGTTVSTEVVPFKKYTTAPAPKTIGIELFQDGALGSMLFGGPSARPMFILLNLLVGSDPVKAIGEVGELFTLEADRVVAGVSCKVLRIESKSGPGLRLLIDSEQKLVRAIDLIFDPTQLLEDPEKNTVTIDRLGWVPGAIVTKDIPADTFAFEPATGFTKVESVAAVVGAKAQNPVDELVGKPAPDFNLTVLDGEGKTRTLSRDDLKGKVVMLDFWATWCEPCLIELPEVQKLIETYAKDKKDVLIVAVSQDDGPENIADVRKLVEKTLAEAKLQLTGTPVGLVAIDPSHSVRDVFQVEGLPTVVLLDPKGVVQAAHVGIPRGDITEVGRKMGQEIDTLLEGKSLAPQPEQAAPGEPAPAQK